MKKWTYKIYVKLIWNYLVLKKKIMIQDERYMRTYWVLCNILKFQHFIILLMIVYKFFNYGKNNILGLFFMDYYVCFHFSRQCTHNPDQKLPSRTVNYFFALFLISYTMFQPAPLIFPVTSGFFVFQQFKIHGVFVIFQHPPSLLQMYGCP